MRACPSLVALLALSRRIQVDAGVFSCSPVWQRFELHHPGGSAVRCAALCSRVKRRSPQALPECSVAQVCVQVCAGCPSFGGQRTVASVRTRVNGQRPSKDVSLSSETRDYKSAPVLQPREPGSFSHHQSRGSLRASIGRLAHSALVCFSIQVRSMVTSPRAWPNPSIERTSQSLLRSLWAAAHVKR